MSHSHDLIHCKNCQNEYHGHYCPNCGQKATTKRLVFNDIFSELLNAFTYFNRGLLYTLKMMSTRPGHSVREYVQGKRVNHFHPVNYLLLIGGVATWIYIHYWDDLFNMEIMFQSMKTREQRAVMPFVKKAIHFAFENYTYQLMINILLYGFFCVKILGKERYNWVEGIVLHLFVLSHSELIKLLLFPFLFFLKNSIIGFYAQSLISSLISMVYMIWAYKQFFEEENTWSAIGKTLLAILAAGVVIAVVSGFGGFFISLFGDKAALINAVTGGK
ncbi:DUF3667 domain-containing protein [Flectobacillus roseus]